MPKSVRAALGIGFGFRILGKGRKGEFQDWFEISAGPFGLGF